MTFAALSKSQRVAPAAPRLAKGKSRHATRHVGSSSGFIGAAPRLGAAMSAHPPGLQTKLKVGEPNDRFEQEADRVADQVMRMPVPGVSIAAAPPQISRKCAECEEEEKLQKKPAGPQAAASEAPALVHEALRSPGQPLDAATRTYFKPRFGYEFSGVRVHTGTLAAQSAREVNAHAYTVGHDIVFGAGKFAPGTPEGHRLIAHELTHVVQQNGLDRAVQQASRISDADVAGLQAANAATSVASMRSTEGLAPLSTPVVQRQPVPPAPPLTRAEEVRLSFTSPGEIAVALNPPTLSLYNFAIDQATLKDKHVSALRAVAFLIKQFPIDKLRIAVNGHADSSGEDKRNDPLSEDRALTVQKALGVPSDASSFGKRRPVATNDTVEGRSHNRRVDLNFYFSGKSKKDGDGDGNGDGNGDHDGSHFPFPCWGPLMLVCACALAPQACLFCLANPALCFCQVFPARCKHKPEPPKKGKVERPCVDSVNLPPPHTIPAQKFETSPYGAWLAGGFHMGVVFKNDDTGCSCRLGEYKQELRGFAERDGGTGVMEPANPAGLVLDRSNYQEDLRDGVLHYGIRSERDTDNDSFLRPDDRETGCEYQGSDTPGMTNGRPGEHMRFHFEFRGCPVDRRNRSTQLEPWRGWTVEGDWHVPHTA